MRPSKILNYYYLVTFLVGAFLAFPVSHWVKIHELGGRGSAIMTLCWNVLFVMLLPLVMDWAERRYFKARFVQLEEVAHANPELAAVISEQCEKLAIPGFRFAVVDTSCDELFSYGLWRSNPRVVIPGFYLKKSSTVSAKDESDPKLIPSVEAELSRFASQDHTMVFLFFAIVQLAIEQVLLLVA